MRRRPAPSAADHSQGRSSRRAATSSQLLPAAAERASITRAERLACRDRRAPPPLAPATEHRSGADGSGATNTDSTDPAFGHSSFGQGGQPFLGSISQDAQGGQPYYVDSGTAGEDGSFNGPGGNGGNGSGNTAYEGGGGVRSLTGFETDLAKGGGGQGSGAGGAGVRLSDA